MRRVCHKSSRRAFSTLNAPTYMNKKIYNHATRLSVAPSLSHHLSHTYTEKIRFGFGVFCVWRSRYWLYLFATCQPNAIFVDSFFFQFVRSKRTTFLAFSRLLISFYSWTIKTACDKCFTNIWRHILHSSLDIHMSNCCCYCSRLCWFHSANGNSFIILVFSMFYTNCFFSQL